MNGKIHKITELEKLQLRKIRLKAEADVHVHALDEHFDYLQNNIGSLLVNSALTAAQSKMPPFLQGLLPVFLGGGSDRRPDRHSQVAVQSSKAGTMIDQVIEILPFLFKGAKPVILAFVLKKIRGFFLSRKNK